MRGIGCLAVPMLPKRIRILSSPAPHFDEQLFNDENDMFGLRKTLFDNSEVTSASSLASIEIVYNSDAPAFHPQTHLTDDFLSEPAYRQKEKTEICKNWLVGACRFG